MDHFDYRDGTLHAEEIPLEWIADTVGTPLFCYSTATLTRHFRVFDAALEAALGRRRRLVAYAVKANSNQAVIATLARLGAGADVVSEGEMRRALAAGVPPEKIVFAGVGKTRAEMATAIEAGVGQFNIESADELDALADVADALGAVAPFAVRVNPDVDPQTHAKISTGKAETKFGVPIGEAPALYARAAARASLAPVGVAAHIGSQLTQLAPFQAAFRHLASLAATLRADGTPIARVDVGGGLGAFYDRLAAPPPSPSAYAAAVAEALDAALPPEVDVVVEPGRLLSANAGVLLTRVIYRKETADRVFLICDAAMNDLIRPTLYDAFHEIEPVVEPAADAERAPVDVVGPVCETADIFASGRPMPFVKAGALLALRTAGAYAAVMASEYNTRPLAPEVMVNGDRFEIVRARPTYDAIIARDRTPSWLSD